LQTIPRSRYSSAHIPPRGRHALFPGSFDPPTLGHLDLVRRAQALFGRVTVGIAANPSKTSLFSAEERVQLFRASLGRLRGVTVVAIEGLSTQAARREGCAVLVRGVRSGSDFDYELPMAHTNAVLLPGLETVLLAPRPEYAHISSTLVRQIAQLGGDVSPFVHPAVARAIARKLKTQP
jgi:pantetheine-phosphate adenylyltransferase